LRPSQNLALLDGVIPVFSKQDTVGPMAKHMDDLVLTYSVINNQPAIYDNFLWPIDGSTLKVLYISDFFDSFQFGRIDYYVDPELNSHFKNSVFSLKNSNVQFNEIRLTYFELLRISSFLSGIIVESSNCLFSCIKSSYNSYFGDLKRFPFDSPYHNFDSFYSSSGLSSLWKQEFVRARSSQALNCEPNCQKYYALRQSITSLIESWLSDDVDVMIMPSITKVVPPIVSNEENKMLSFSFLSVYSNMPFLNVPAGFNKEGLPLGLGLISRPEKIENLFKIAKLFENGNNFSRLPRLIPAINKRCDFTVYRNV
jgi:Asp-tRNA(Asn)/Glu-tRNA(Gln) amidotransferase A subunit family amidase